MEDAPVTPWLDEKLLTQILQSGEESEQKVELISFRCQPALPPGSNNLSQVFRVRVEYKTGLAKDVKTISLIVKIPLDSNGMKEFVDKLDGYMKEVNIYSNILPKMYELHSYRATARSFPCPLDGSLVLEDLKVGGYKMVDRLKQMDVPHVCQTLECMAKLHALSVVAHRKDTQAFENVGIFPYFNERLVSEDPVTNLQENSSTVAGFLAGLLHTITRIPGCEKYIKMIRKIEGSYWESMVQLLKTKRRLSVLNHGDVWTTNVMFKYDEAGEVINAKLVDFQLTHFSSFAFDIIFFWWTSANENIREHHKEQMFEVYRHSLNQMFEALQCNERLSKEDFDQEMKICAPFSIYTLASTLPYTMADPEDLVDFNKISLEEFSKASSDSPQWKYFTSKYYRALFPKILQQVEEFGAFQ